MKLYHEKVDKAKSSIYLDNTSVHTTFGNIFTLPTMDAINNSAFASTSDPKTAIMNSVRQEAAVANARQLIDVSY